MSLAIRCLIGLHDYVDVVTSRHEEMVEKYKDLHVKLGISYYGIDRIYTYARNYSAVCIRCGKDVISTGLKWDIEILEKRLKAKEIICQQ